MDGIFFLEGYKLKHRIVLNLQKHTVLLSHSDMFTPPVLFDMIERYFNKQNFSDVYQTNVHIRLNEKKLSPTDFQVWRIRPTVNVEADYDEMEEMILDNDCHRHSPEVIKQEFMKDLFNEQIYKQKYGEIDTIFRK